jgi:hypothetical protein
LVKGEGGGNWEEGKLLFASASFSLSLLEMRREKI